MAEARPLKRVAIQLDKERCMMFDWNAMYLIEERITARRGGGWVSMQILGDLTKLSIADMRTVIWGSLVHEDEGLTEKDVGKMIHMGNTAYVCEKMAEAMDQGEDASADDSSEKVKPSQNGKDPLEGAAG